MCGRVSASYRKCVTVRHASRTNSWGHRPTIAKRHQANMSICTCPARESAPWSFLETPIIPPLTSSASRDLKRPRPIPKKVGAAIVMMVRGLPDDEDQRPLSFIAAAKAAGIGPDTMRRYLDRPEVIVMLRRERRAYREALCGGNEGARRRSATEVGMTWPGLPRCASSRP